MNKNKKLAVNLCILASGMLMLAYASVPLYNMFCKITGYGGTTQVAKELPKTISDRVINVKFNADIDRNLNWEFRPGESSRNVRVGENGLTWFVSHNLENKPVKGMAVYNVVPFKAGQYFNKIHCFCFNEQTLEANQKVDMPVSFFIDPAILSDPELKDVNTITLSYTFFPAVK